MGLVGCREPVRHDPVEPRSVCERHGNLPIRGCHEIQPTVAIKVGEAYVTHEVSERHERIARKSAIAIAVAHTQILEVEFVDEDIEATVAVKVCDGQSIGMARLNGDAGNELAVALTEPYLQARLTRHRVTHICDQILASITVEVPDGNVLRRWNARVCAKAIEGATPVSQVHIDAALLGVGRDDVAVTVAVNVAYCQSRRMITGKVHLFAVAEEEARQRSADCDDVQPSILVEIAQREVLMIATTS